MLLLALDTSTSAVTVALHDGGRVIANGTVLDPRGHGERLAPEIDRVLRAAGRKPGEVTDVVCGLGPGPFTGLRVGIVTARVFAHAAGATLRGLASLDALAFSTRCPGEFLVATDARRKEVYWARYAAADAWPTRVTTPAVARPADLPAELRALPTAGRGPVLYPSLFPNPVPPLDVDAVALAELSIARLAAGDDLAQHEPLYLRRPDAAPSVLVKSALG